MADDRDPRPRLLVVDDGETYARVVAEQLTEFRLVKPAAGVDRLADGPAALRYLQKHSGKVDLILLDMNFAVEEDRLLPLADGATLRRTRRFQGVAILREIRRRLPRIPVVLLTAEGDLSLVDEDGELASQSMTYFLDSDDLDALRIRIHRALSEAALGLEESDVLWGRNPAMGSLRSRMGVVARGSMPLILEGETGTGKSYLAERFVHRNSGRKGPFVVLDLSTVPSDLISAHLFGAVRGAFTGAVTDQMGVFEAAHGGTLFIDEIQNVPLEVQKQLLLVLQDRRVRRLGSTREVPVDVKVVAASNSPLGAAVAAGRFRADLYMRLSPATRVLIPPLRDRADDLAFFAKRFAERTLDDADLATLRDRLSDALKLDRDAPLELVIGRPAKSERRALQLSLPEPAWNLLRNHSWPGNMRELSMVIHNLVAFTLVAAVDALHSEMQLTSPRLQADPGLVGGLLAGSAPLSNSNSISGITGDDWRSTATTPSINHPYQISLNPADKLNSVAQDVERQYMLQLFRETSGDFGEMAESLLGDAGRTRAVRLRFNQLGLKVREIRSAARPAGSD